MSPSILVEDCGTKQYVKVFKKSEELIAFLKSEKQSGVDIESKYLIHAFSVERTFDTEEALDAIKTFGYLPNYDDEYDDE